MPTRFHLASVRHSSGRRRRREVLHEDKESYLVAKDGLPTSLGEDSRIMILGFVCKSPWLVDRLLSLMLDLHFLDSPSQSAASM